MKTLEFFLQHFDQSRSCKISELKKLKGIKNQSNNNETQ